ncbi:MAG TPA: nuclear transport factor 2 family protein [Allosphingosinicella sp.]|jgi:ketosteroid isomerase-like protein
MNEDEAQIRALIEERAAAIRAKDAARAVATLAADVVAFELAPPLALGAGQARDETALAAWLDGWEGPPAIEIRDLHVEAAGEVAWSRSLNRLHGRLRDGREVDMWMRSTLGFRKAGGAWKIAHGHSSVPFRMDGSYRAALDLVPEG